MVFQSLIKSVTSHEMKIRIPIKMTTNSNTQVITAMTCGNLSFVVRKAQQGLRRIENNIAIIKGMSISCAMYSVKNKAIKLTKVSDSFTKKGSFKVVVIVSKLFLVLLSGLFVQYRRIQNKIALKKRVSFYENPLIRYIIYT